MKNYKTYIGWGLSLLLIVGVLAYLGPSVFQQMLQADPQFLFLALLTTTVILITTTLRWQLILNHLVGPQTPPFLDLLNYVLVGATVGLLVPRDVGEMSTRIASMKLLHQVTLRKVTWSVLVDRFFDVLILIPFTLAALPFLGGLSASPPVLVAMHGIMLFLCLGLLGYKPGYGMMLNLVRRIYARLYPGWSQTSMTRVLSLPSPQTLKSVPAVLSPGLMVGAFGWTIMKFLALALRAYLIVRALDLDISFEAILLSTPIAQASLILAFTPGGLGFNELGWYGALTILEVNATAIPPFLVGHRLFNYGFVLVLALIVQVVYMLHNRKNHVRKLL